MSKRPRAETQSQSSPQRTRIRIDESRSLITLFDEAELAGVDISVLQDGQISDYSDAGLDLPPLTESPSGSDTEDDSDEETPPSNIGDQTGIRKATNNYHLSGTLEDLSGPDSEVPELTPPKLTRIRSEIMGNFCTYLIQHWPTTRLNEELACDRHIALTDPIAFWYALFQFEFARYLEHIEKLPVENQSQRKIQAGNLLFDELKAEIKAKTPFSSGLLLTIYASCMGHLSKSNDSETIQSLKESYELGKKIKEAKRVGKNCRKHAVWIPVTRCDPDPILHQHMTETKRLFNTGEKSGAIQEDGVMVRVDLGWKLMAAPPKSDKSSYSIIFWEPMDKSDYQPTLEKVVGACIHGAQNLSPIFGDPKSDHIWLQCTAAVHNLQTKTAVDRNIKQAGIMTKDIGQQSSYGTPYELLPRVSVATSANPTKKTIKKIEEQKQLRMDIKKYNPAIQSINFALLQGFLPHFAVTQYIKAVEKLMVNGLGRPNTASFATYAYCAGLHLDNDESITHGWVIKRGKEVTRRESNFVWGNYRLILELNEGSHWFWRANIDAHGTTANKIAMQYPGKWKTPALNEGENAQWTRVNTIPKAVADAMLRRQQ